MLVCVIGATGVLGRAVLPRLLESGHHVRAVVRTDAAVEALARLKVEVAKADILCPDALEPALHGAGAVLNLATVVPRPGEPAEWALNDRIRREGTANLVKACRQNNVERLVQQSIAHLVANGSADPLDETAPLHPTVVTQSAAEMESTVRASGLHWTILRGGAFYGPGTGRDEYWRAQARTGMLKFPAEGQAFISLIHVADFADAMVRALLSLRKPDLIAVVDESPVNYAELFEHIAAVERAPSPDGGGPPLWPSFRIVNDRAKSKLNWLPRYASYRSGFA